MARLELHNISVEFPLYQAPTRSLRRAVLNASVGGLIKRANQGDKLVVRGVRDITLRLRPGDRLALVGHNGAGKTTLLRVMAGIYRPTSGNVVRDGRCLPMIDIHSGFDDEATGYETILLRGLLLGYSRAEIERLTPRIAEFSELGDFLNLPVRTYSAGMMVRLLFSIVALGEADVLLMDEWIAQGDQDFLEKANRRLHEFVREAQIVVLASHNLDLLRQVCNRAVLLESGRIAKEGPLEEVLGAYTTAVAG